MMNGYEKEYGGKYVERMDFIEKQILNPEPKDKICVINTEAGLGKSYKVNSVIDECLSNKDDTRKFLVVKKFSSDVVGFVKYLEHHNKNIEKIPKVLGLISENFNEWKSRLCELKEVNAIAMTHARYIIACNDEELRKSLVDNRDVLIIDEKLDFPVYTYNKTSFDSFRACYPFELQHEVDKVCKKLNDVLYNLNLDGQYNTVVKVGKVNIHHKTLENFIKLTKSDMQLIEQSNRNKVRAFIEILELMYSTKLTYYQGNLSTFDREHKVWMIPKGVNLLLDASAKIESCLYSLNNKFELLPQERIIDHSDSIFTFIHFNSSKTNIKNNENEYFKEIAKLAKNDIPDNEKLLIVLHKENHNKMRDALINEKVYSIALGDDYVDEQVSINWLNNLIGKNVYSDFENILIIGSPNIPMQVYLQYYMQYAEKDDLGRKDLGITKGKFNNDTFEAIRLGNLTAEIYQCLKRVQRVPRPKGKFWIVNNNINVVSTIIDELKGLSIEGENKNVFIRKFDFDESKQKAKPKTKLDLLINKLWELPEGEYTKAEICEMLNMDKTHMSRYINHRRIKELKFVEVSTRKVVISGDKEHFNNEDESELHKLNN